MINIIICDDQDIVREGLKTIISSDPEITVTDTAANGRELLALLESEKIDLVLLDLKMPEMNGIQAAQAIHQRHPGVKILVLTTYSDDEWIFDAIRCGINGYLLKDTPRETLIAAIKGTVEGDSYIDPSIGSKILTSVRTSSAPASESTSLNISSREREIILLMARGLSNADIAKELYLSEGTIKNYTSTIFTKLGVNDRTQAAISALRMGLVTLGDL